MTSRYINDSTLRQGKILSTAKGVDTLRTALREGKIPFTERTLREGERIDQIAGEIFGDGRLWWVLAAISNIGWPMQLPPGTIIKIPLDMPDVLRLI